MEPSNCIPKYLSLISLIFLLSACGGSSSSPNSPSTTFIVKTGVFVDAIVEGAAYTTATQSGYTNEKGEYLYIEGENVEFFLGAYSLGSSKAKGVISPYSLHPNDENRSLYIARILQTIDNDANTSNGIKIANAKIFTHFDGLVSMDDVRFEAQLNTIIQANFSRTLISMPKAKEHLNATLNIVSQGDVNTSAVANNSFNTYDPSTFSSSTCNLVPAVVPSGVFASVDGHSSATGTLDDPLDLETALSSSSPLQEGETLWIKEGVYKGSYRSELIGTSTNPIKVKPMPGKRVLIDNTAGDSAGLTVSGAWTEYYGLEVLSKQMDRDTPANSYGDIEFKINGGVTVGGTGRGSNTKVINFIVHDNVGGGFSSWSDAPDSELYGNIIYNNGWTAPKRGHGHAIYAQNKTGFKKLTNNIIFFGFGTGVHVYTEGGGIKGFDVQDNVWYMTGASDPRTSQRKDNCLIGGFQPVKDLTLKNNLGLSLNSRGTRIGYGGSVEGQNAVLSGNYLSENFWVAGYWDSLNVSSTTVHRGLTGSRQDQVIHGGGNNFTSAPPTSGKHIVVSPNKYDASRARVVIYNYDNDANVSVDLSGVLKVGEAYRIHSTWGLFNNPLVSGLYDGTEVIIPMDTIEPPQPTGLDGIEDADNPHKTFGVFLVTHGVCE